MTGTDADRLDAVLACVARHAGDLRALGVTRVRALGVTVEIAPTEPRIELDEAPPRALVAQVGIDPLDDPATYGGSIPRMRRRESDA